MSALKAVAYIKSKFWNKTLCKKWFQTIKINLLWVWLVINTQKSLLNTIAEIVFYSLFFNIIGKLPLCPDCVVSHAKHDFVFADESAALEVK